MLSPILSAEGLVRTEGDQRTLNGLDLSLSAGRVLAVMGANGAGKTTLLYVAAGLLSYQAGTLWRRGSRIPVENVPDPGVALLSHQSFLYSHMSLGENLTFYGRLYGISDIGERARWAARRVGLHWAIHDLVGTFSRGMRQRAGLARLLMQDASLWLLDEPETGLDEEGRRCLEGLIHEQRDRGTAVLFSTHWIHEARRLADALAVLKAGRFVWWSHDRAHWNIMARRYLGSREDHA